VRWWGEDKEKLKRCDVRWEIWSFQAAPTPPPIPDISSPPGSPTGPVSSPGFVLRSDPTEDRDPRLRWPFGGTEDVGRWRASPPTQTALGNSTRVTNQRRLVSFIGGGPPGNGLANRRRPVGRKNPTSSNQ